MNRITRLKIENFRRLKSLDLEMRPLGVMVGANGCGKTSIFDALSLLKAAVEGKLSERMSELGGFTSNLTLDGSETMTFGIEVTLDLNDTNDETEDLYKHYYELKFKQEGLDFIRVNEFFQQTYQGKTEEKNIPFPKEKTSQRRALIRLPQEADDRRFSSTSVEPFRMVLRNSMCFQMLQTDKKSPVRLPQQIAPEFLPKQGGENLLSVLYNLREQQPEAYDEIIDTLKIAFPGFESLALPNVAAGMMSLAWNDRNFRNALYQHQMSEGMLRMLWLTTILLNPHLTPLTMIDEPEVSLHPELLAILTGCFRKATAYTQLLAATHSTDLIRNLHPSEVLVMDMDENGMTSARWGDDPELNLDDWLKDYTLGDVWQMGLLGGRAS